MKKLAKFSHLSRNHLAFTIVELLVVIVVIGILATITIVSYTGITQKVVVTSLQSDLINASDQLEIYVAHNEAYPGSVTDCPTPVAGNICLKPTSGNTYDAYSYEAGDSFCLTALNDSKQLQYHIDNNGTPIEGECSVSTPPEPVDVTLRPTGAGTYTEWLHTAHGAHYLEVDEEATDEWGTWIAVGVPDQRDSFATSHSIPTEATINSVQIFGRVYCENAGSGKLGFYDGVGLWWGGEIATPFNAWKDVNTGVLTANPRTSEDWTLGQIDALEIGAMGVNVNVGSNYYFYTTQIYANVNYTY